MNSYYIVYLLFFIIFFFLFNWKSPNDSLVTNESQSLIIIIAQEKFPSWQFQFLPKFLLSDLRSRYTFIFISFPSPFLQQTFPFYILFPIFFSFSSFFSSSWQKLWQNVFLINSFYSLRFNLRQISTFLMRILQAWQEGLPVLYFYLLASEGNRNVMKRVQPATLFYLFISSRNSCQNPKQSLRKIECMFIALEH